MDLAALSAYACWLRALLMMMAMGHSSTTAEHAREHPVRARIVEHLRRKPMSTKSAIRDGAGAGWGAVQHHLGILLRCKLIRSIKVGRRDRYFLPDVTVADAGPLSVLQQGRASDVAAAIVRRAGATQHILLQDLKMSRKMFRTYLQRLLEVNLVVETKEGRCRMYQPAPELGTYLRRMVGEDAFFVDPIRLTRPRQATWLEVPPDANMHRMSRFESIPQPSPQDSGVPDDAFQKKSGHDPAPLR